MKTNWSLSKTFLIILALTVIGSACGGGGPATFSPNLYVVRIEDGNSSKGIYNAKVIVEAIGIGKITEVSDTDGYARLFIPSDYVGEPGRLIVEVEGYSPYRSEINLYTDQLPTRVLIERVASGESAQDPNKELQSSDTSMSPQNPELPDMNADSPNSSQELPITPVDIPPVGSEQMVYITEGEFLMGSSNIDASAHDDEKPQIEVYLDGYYLDIYEITNSQYSACVKAGKCSPPSETSSNTRSSYYDNPDYANYPVIWVNWNQAKAFCQWRGDALPTEAQWEKAARGINGQRYPWGDDTPNCTLANSKIDSQECVGDTTMVGSYAPNGYGLFDIAGNVWEWVQDWYQPNYYISLDSLKNPLGPDFGIDRALRGGSWASPEGFMRSAHRNKFVVDNENDGIGFRCARTP